MSQYKDVSVGSVVYLWFSLNNKLGSQSDGSTPLYAVRLAGAAAGAAAKATGTPTLLTHANYFDGTYEIAIDTTGYDAGEYAVFCSATVSSINPAGFVGSFVVRAAASTQYELVTELLTRIPDATPGATGGVQVVGAAITGAVATNAGNTASTFETTLTSAVNNYYARALILITNGALIGQLDKITAYDGANKIVTLATGFTGIPADDVTFKVINE